MEIPRFAVCMFSVGMVLGTGTVCGQDYPNKPIRIVTSGAGGGNDFAARVIAQGITGALGQQVIIDNRPSAVIPGQTVSQSPPDGYTLLVAGTTFLIGPLLQKAPYDPIRDFSPITVVSKEPGVVVVHPSMPVKSIKELIALAKSRPGELNYGSVGVGSTPHLAAELFKSMANVKIQHVAYKGTGQMLNDLIGGHVQLAFSPASPVTPHVKSGKLRGLAVTSAEPSTLVPGLPTVAATVPGYEDVGITVVLAPVKTPAAVINRLNQEIGRFLKTPEAKERFLNAGAEAVGSSPEELGVAMKSEITKKGKMIKDAGITAD